MLATGQLTRTGATNTRSKIVWTSRLAGVLAVFLVPLACNNPTPKGGAGGEEETGNGGSGGSSGHGGSGPASGGSTGKTGGSAGSNSGGSAGEPGGSAGSGGDSGSAGAGGSTGGASGDGGAGGGASGGGGMSGDSKDAGATKDAPAAKDANATKEDAGAAKEAGRDIEPLPMCAEPNKGLDPSKFEISTLNCNSPGLTWHSANVTNYDSNPAPGSSECIEFNGCYWAGKFNTCGDCLVKSKPWIASHKVVALFPLKNYGLHTLCIKQGGKMVEVVAYDTCGDSDCDGCCTQNRGSADALIDIEKQTLRQTGLSGSGTAQWADLGYKGATCTDSK